MYTKCLYTKCIPHFDKLLYTFCMQNLAAIFLLIFYTKCVQNFVEIWYTFCIHQFYTSCTICAYKMYTVCICIMYAVLRKTSNEDATVICKVMCSLVK